MSTRRKLILVSARDAAANFYYYNRKNDEELSTEDINAAIESGEVTVDEIVTSFRDALQREISDIR